MCVCVCVDHHRPRQLTSCRPTWPEVHVCAMGDAEKVRAETCHLMCAEQEEVILEEENSQPQLSHLRQSCSLSALLLISVFAVVTLARYSGQIQAKNEIGINVDHVENIVRGLTALTGSSACSLKKKVVLDVGNYGIGNRMLALASAAVFSVMTDRVLEIKWERTPSCRQSLDEIFVPKDTSALSLKPFVYDSKNLRVFKIREKVQIIV